MNLLPRLTCLEPYATFTATFGLMLGIRVGTTPLEVNARTTAADDCADMPTGEHFVARLSTGVGVAKAAVAVSKAEMIVLSCMLELESVLGIWKGLLEVAQQGRR